MNHDLENLSTFHVKFHPMLYEIHQEDSKGLAISDCNRIFFDSKYNFFQFFGLETKIFQQIM